MIQAKIMDSTSKPPGDKSNLLDRSALVEAVLIFSGAALLLFLFSDRIVNVFDEGILLTGTMQTMAGQVLHRDFYFNYGPAQLYLLAGLFKLFGPSVLVERLTEVCLAAGLVASMYVLTRKFCGRAFAFGAAVVSIFWSIGLWLNHSVMNPALCILVLWTSWLILPVSDDRAQRRRAVGAGFLAAMAFLVRYDMGVGTLVADMLAVVMMMWMQEPRLRRSLRRVATTVMVPYLSAFVLTVLPFALAYLSVAPLHDLLDDTLLYGKWAYPVGRGLPFPKPRLGPAFMEIAFYLLPVIIVLGFWCGFRCLMTRKRRATDQPAKQTPDWLNLLTVLSVVAAVLAAKGLVRAGIAGMCVSAIACVLLLAILLKHQATLHVWVRVVLTATAVLFVLAAVSSVQTPLFYPSQSLRHLHLKPLVINWILTPARQPPSPPFRNWCHEGTPITRGFCFLLDEDRIKSVRYLDAHTHPGDYLYSGLTRHDRILMNDMITYFAAQRLPAVKWAQLDPMVENLSDRQQEMIRDLELHKPPYVVLDAEFDGISEPNGSSAHTGVHLLDDYITAHYRTVQRYGNLTILQRED